jgi:ubiquinone/menaquinone biosynthesis C-methylase UbiE
MAMTKLEKQFVNRERKAQRNIAKLEQHLEHLDKQNINNVLELGCGIGGVSAHLADKYQMNVYGTDFDPQQIEIARRMYPENDRLRFGVEDASNLSCEDNIYDLVVSQNVFHHVPDWEKAIQEICRVLKPGGYLMWLDLAFPQWIIKIFRPFVKNYGLYTFDNIESEFTQNGFLVVYRKRLLHGIFTHYHLVLEKC